MYKKITKNDKVTRKITDVHSADNYLTKETTKNISLAINKLDGKLDLVKTVNERVFYFISADVNFIIDNEKYILKMAMYYIYPKILIILLRENLKQLLLILLLLE